MDFSHPFAILWRFFQSHYTEFSNHCPLQATLRQTFFEKKIMKDYIKMK